MISDHTIVDLSTLVGRKQLEFIEFIDGSALLTSTVNIRGIGDLPPSIVPRSISPCEYFHGIMDCERALYYATDFNEY